MVSMFIHAQTHAHRHTLTSRRVELWIGTEVLDSDSVSQRAANIETAVAIAMVIMTFSHALIKGKCVCQHKCAQSFLEDVLNLLIF